MNKQKMVIALAIGGAAVGGYLLGFKAKADQITRAIANAAIDGKLWKDDISKKEEG